MEGEKRVSAVDSLKEIVVFLAALTFANAISTLLLDEQTKQLRALSQLRTEDVLCFVLLVFGLIRFYHGNYRFLDESYKIGIQRGGLLNVSRKNIIWFDFFSILIVALAFSVQSFFIRQFSYFVCLYAVIVLTDVIWLYFTNQKVIIRRSSSGFSLQTSGLSWFYNNILFLTLVVIFVIAGYAATAIFDRDSLEMINFAVRTMKLEDVRWLFWGLTILIFVNSVIDFRFNWDLYFPGAKQDIPEFSVLGGSIKHVFLAAPFTQLLQQKGKVKSIGFHRQIIEEIINLFDARGVEVFSAHRRELWGEKLEQPAKALRFDLDEILRSDLVVAIIGDPPSPGVQLELGYAIALKKPIILLLKKDEFVPYLIRGLNAAASIKEIEFDHEDQIAVRLKRALHF